MQSYEMKVSKKENGAYVEVGSVDVFFPVLAEMGLEVKPSKWETTNDKGEQVEAKEGDVNAFPVYDDERIQYVFDAMLAAVKANARNRLVSGTATLKPDNTIPDTVEALIATGERSGEALKQRREYFNSFKTYLGTLGKSAAYVQGMFDIVSNVKNIPYQSPARKTAVSGLVSAHAATLDADSIAKWERTMLQIEANCKEADPLAE